MVCFLDKLHGKPKPTVQNFCGDVHVSRIMYMCYLNSHGIFSQRLGFYLLAVAQGSPVHSCYTYLHITTQTLSDWLIGSRLTVIVRSMEKQIGNFLLVFDTVILVLSSLNLKKIIEHEFWLVMILCLAIKIVSTQCLHS